MQAEILDEEEINSFIPEGIQEVCVTTTVLPSQIAVGGSVQLEIHTHPEHEGGGQGLEEDGNESPFACHKCGLMLSTKSTFDTHMAQVHVEEAYYACEFCPATGIHWSEYYLHQCTNMDNKPLVCPHCQEQVSTKKQLSAHEEVHALQRRFTTKKLDSYFQRKLEEAQDPAVDWGQKPFICGVCGKLFGKLYEVEYHEKLHSQEREPPNKCWMCGLSYLNKNDLNKHVAKGCNGPLARKTTHTPRIE